MFLVIIRFVLFMCVFIMLQADELKKKFEESRKEYEKKKEHMKEGH